MPCGWATLPVPQQMTASVVVRLENRETVQKVGERRQVRGKNGSATGEKRDYSGVSIVAQNVRLNPSFPTDDIYTTQNKRGPERPTPGFGYTNRCFT